jgi:hypothetical protein
MVYFYIFLLYMSNEYKVEFFQDSSNSKLGYGTGSDLNEAYTETSLKSLISDVAIGSQINSGANAYASNSNSDVHSNVIINENSRGTLWDFMGMSKLGDNQKKCYYNCGVDVFGCMEKCLDEDYLENNCQNKEQCRYSCVSDGLVCSHSCMNNIDTNLEGDTSLDQVQTTSIIGIPIPNNTNINTNVNANINTNIDANNFNPTSQSTLSLQEVCKKHYDLLPNEVNGINSDIDNLAPYDMRSWPREGKYGWTLTELNRMKRNGYDAPDVIEVNMNHSLYPVLSDKPLLEFEYIHRI